MNEKTEMHAYNLKGLFEEETEFSNLLIHNELFGAFGSQTTFTNCTFQDCAIKGCFFDGATFKNCSFYGCDIAAVDLSNCVFEDCTFASRFDMCDLSDTTFTNCSFRRGYMRCCTFDDTLFANVTFDGIWAGKLHVVKPVKFDGAIYTMGGATHEEMEIAKENFFKQFEKEEVVMTKSCLNCANSCIPERDETCRIYEAATSEKACIQIAETCPLYKKEEKEV